MFERFIIVPASLRNTSRDGVDGFELKLRLAYYRGLGLSMVESIELTVDGNAINPATLHFTVEDGTFTFAEMEHQVDARWELNEAATVFAPFPGGLAPGDHTVFALEVLRISYMPALARRGDTKTLTVI